MISSLKTAAAIAANYSGFLDGYAFLRRRHTKSQVAILMYHRVCPINDSWSLKPLGPRSFERQIEYLHRNYEILSLDRLVHSMQQGRRLPEKAVVITFDDGYKDNYLHVYPILRNHHIPATILLTTGHIGAGRLLWFDKVGYALRHATADHLELDELGTYTLESEFARTYAKLSIVEKLKRLPEERKNLLIQNLLELCQANIPANLGHELILSWHEVREMHNNGVSFGAHSVTHPILTNLPLEQARWEIVRSKKDIEERLGGAINVFAYPDGDYNEELVEVVRQSGFTVGVTTEPELVSCKANPYKLPRIGALQDFNKFKVVFSGLYQDLRLNRLF